MSPDPARSLIGEAGCSTPRAEEQERLDVEELVLSSLDPLIEDCGTREIDCPRQGTVTFWDQNDGLHHLVRVLCKTWSCPYCGMVKRGKLQADIQAARPNRFVTLTCTGKTDRTPREVFDQTRRQISELGKQYRREGSEFEYLRALETHKSGFPHFHLLVRSKYLAQRELSHRWCHLTGAFIVDIQALTQDENAARYVMKYLGKQDSVPFTNRRLSWTRKFFPEREPLPPSKSDPIGVETFRGRAEDVMRYEFPACRWEWINRWHAVRKGS